MMFDNLASLKEAVNEALYKAALQVADKMLDDLKSNIKKDVYDAYTPTYYTRVNGDGDFYNSWTYLDQQDSDGATFEILQDYNKMVFNPDMWQHGSPIDGDARQELATYIAYGVTNGAWGDMDARDFWTPFTDALKQHKYDDEILKALKANGLEAYKGFKYRNTGLSALEKIFTV